MSLEVDTFTVDYILYTFAISFFVALVIAFVAMYGFKQKDSDGGYSRL